MHPHRRKIENFDNKKSDLLKLGAIVLIIINDLYKHYDGGLVQK